MKPSELNKNAERNLRRLERMTDERNRLLKAVLFIRKMARCVPDERAIFIEACDEVLKALAERQRREKSRKF
jgi:hypothetical protein